MSSPQRQVGSRRLPPLPQGSHTFVRVDNARGGATSNTPKIQNGTAVSSTAFPMGGKLPYDLSAAFMEGPFRPALQADSFSQFLAAAQMPSQELIPSEYLEPSHIEQYLKDYPGFLDNYIKANIPKSQVEKWLDCKVQAALEEQFLFGGLAHGNRPSAKWKNCSSLERQNFMEMFVAEVHRSHTDVRGRILSQLIDSAASAVDADGHILYLIDQESKKIWQYISQSNKSVNLQDIKEGTTISCYVAATKETVRTNQISGDERFPNGIGVQDTTAYSVLCQPIIQPNGDLCGVTELIRVVGMPVFTEKDEQIMNSYLTWGGIVLYYAEMYHTMHKQRKLNEFLLNVTKSIFQDIVSMDTVIMKIMNFAQTLVDADRTSLFLVDTKTNELYARIFDIGTGLDTKLQKEIRFPKSKGVAGHVASTGEIINVTDAYNDHRFNREIDVQTGYTTRTLLCMPIFIRGNVIGVVQMVNKKHGVFTAGDEKAFQTFAIYCGLALHHAKLYDKIRRSEQKYKVALEVLSYHSMCTEYEVDQMTKTETPAIGGNDVDRTSATGERQLSMKDTRLLDRFEFSCYDLDGIQLAKLAVEMFEKLFSFNKFDYSELTRFTLTVRKNYRRVPYHNWTHAFNVAHCMYCCIKGSNGKFPELEGVALFIACLCHDLDHRGKNNDWMKTESTPLASVYTTSTLEHHHFNQTITILQHEGHNIFSHFNSTDYKKVLGYIKDCILSTDLATFFGNKAKLQTVVQQNEFDWENIDHRKMFRALAMTACDLSACAKPWKVQYETVKVIFQEFYAQGDEEKALGRTPVPMMDRDTADKLPQHQVGFLLGICVPCYDLLQKLIPGTKPLLDGAKKNLDRWKEMVKQQSADRAEENAANTANDKVDDKKDDDENIKKTKEKSLVKQDSVNEMEKDLLSKKSSKEKPNSASSQKKRHKSSSANRSKSSTEKQ